MCLYSAIDVEFEVEQQLFKMRETTRSKTTALYDSACQVALLCTFYPSELHLHTVIVG